MPFLSLISLGGGLVSLFHKNALFILTCNGFIIAVYKHISKLIFLIFLAFNVKYNRYQ